MVFGILKTSSNQIWSLIVGIVVEYHVMQAYGTLALEDNSEVGEVLLGRCSISCVCTSAF